MHHCTYDKAAGCLLGGEEDPVPKYLDAMLELVRRRYADWDGFEHAKFVEDERTYKVNASAQAQQYLSLPATESFARSGDFPALRKVLKGIAGSTNLLYLRVPKSSDLAVLDDDSLNHGLFCRELRYLLHGTGSSEDRLTAFSQYLTAYKLPNKWTFPTYFLFLCHPDSDIYVRPSVMKWYLTFTGAGSEYTTQPTAECYRAIRGRANELRRDLKDYRPQDLIDVQGFIWVCYEEATGHHRAK